MIRSLRRPLLPSAARCLSVTRATDHYFFGVGAHHYCQHRERREHNGSTQQRPRGGEGGRHFETERRRGQHGGGGRGRGRPPSYQGTGRHGNNSRPRRDYEEEQQQRSPPPTVPKEKIKSITVTASKNKKKGGGSKYCYGCGATIVQRADQEAQTSEAGSRLKGDTNLQMGVRASAGGYWHEQKAELKISQIKNWVLCSRCRDLKRNAQSGEIGEHQLKALSPSHDMTQVFREQVSKIRSKADAVVVLCIDAINPRGSLIATLRNYVGGHPILLAVTRCDLLPEYIIQSLRSDETQQDRIKAFYKRQAKELMPADVYLCSVDDEDEEEAFDGSQQLSKDLIAHLNGRDTYVIGAANIGKSTLTDRLIDNIIQSHGPPREEPDDLPKIYRRKGQKRKNAEKKAEKKRRYGRGDFHGRGGDADRRDRQRYKSIQSARVTKSSLPGTTLNNVRVPCFRDYKQALWDTPGLLLDPSLSHYPIRDFHRVRAMKPGKIVPQWHDVNVEEGKNGFSLIVHESGSDGGHDDNAVDRDDDDPLPLLRIEVRLKKNAKREALAPSVRLVWNSILNKSILSTRIMSIDEAHAAEKRRIASRDDEATKREKARENDGSSSTQQEARQQRTPEEKAKDKEMKRLQYEEKKRAEIAELGREEWEALQERKKDEHHRQRARKDLAALTLVGQDEIAAGKPMEVDIEHFGSLGILSPSSDALVLVYAPSSGIMPVCQDVMIVPPQWEDGVGSSDGGDVSPSAQQRDEDYDEWMEENESGEEDEWGDQWWKDDDDGDRDVSSAQQRDVDDDEWTDDDDSDEKEWQAELHDELKHVNEWGEQWWKDNGDDIEGYSSSLDFESWNNGIREYASLEGIEQNYGDDDGPASTDAYDRWSEFSGENIGWRFDDKPRYVRGEFVDGWHPVEKAEDDKKCSQEKDRTRLRRRSY